MTDNIVVKSSGNTIKLQSSPEEVTGGYFDSEEVWHEFGGGGGGPLTGKQFHIRQMKLSTDTNMFFPFQASIISGDESGKNVETIIGANATNGQSSSYLFGIKTNNSGLAGTGSWAVFKVDGTVGNGVGDLVIEIQYENFTEAEKTAFLSMFEEI